MGARRRFTAEFKREAVQLTRQPGAVTARIADDLGLHPNVLRKWVQQFAQGKWEARTGAPLKSEQQAELERLRRELKRVTTERDILKKAMAYFAKEPQ
jgi:transposase